jgi:glycosyltransferase involved in cell wall biosynthesis
MRLLHVGSGFRPWRRGGLVAYVEDLIDEQVRRNDECAYFFSGRQYPLARGPRLRRWERAGVPMIEVIDSPLYDHGRQPELELTEPRIERMLERVLEQVRPDVVHVHELAGLPSSLLDVIDRSGTPAVVTLQDYFPLCPAFKLLDAEGRVCTRREVGADCVATLAADPRDPGLLIDATVAHHLMRHSLLRRIPPVHRERLVAVTARVSGGLEAARRSRRNGGPAGPEAFQRRREVNVERLGRADRLIAMSTRVAEIYAGLGVRPDRLRTMQLTLGHIERLTPRSPPRHGQLTFATLAGFESAPKGALLLLDAMRQLARPASEGRFRLLVFGYVAPEFAEQVERLPGVEVRGRYAPRQMDAILDEVDVGLMPSVWEEAYGYAGIEFLAKGIPVIANAIGGMPDYARDGETGWLNRSCAADELVRIVAGVIERPEQIAELNAKLRANRDSIVMTMSRHAAEMEAIYREVIAERAGAADRRPVARG